MSEYKIALVDDEVLFRRGLHHIIDQHQRMQVLLEAENGNDLMAKLRGRDSMPDLVLLDMEMPEMDGVATLKELQKKYPKIQVVILTSHYNATLIVKMIELGASAFMSKSADLNTLVDTITNVLERGFHYDAFTVRLLRDRMINGISSSKDKVQDVFTKRELEILQLIGKQYTNKQIAETLYISPRTVEGHRNKMLDKTGSKNTVGLIIFAIDNGIVRLEDLREKQN